MFWRTNKQYEDQIAILLESIEEKDKEILKLKRNYNTIKIGGFDSLECEPSDTNARLEYIKSVDFFFDDILKDKLKTGVAEIREMMSNMCIADVFPHNVSRIEYDSFLRGMEAGLWKIHDWAIALQGERKAILQDKENEDNGIL